MFGSLAGKNIIVGVTGGIAAYKSCYLVSALKKAGANVDVIMTKNAAEFVSPLSFQTLSQRPCVTDTFSQDHPFEVEHISLAKKADLFVVAPATANIIAKMASGIADDMLSTTLLASKAPILIAPAMNCNMWENAATQENMEKLVRRGVHVAGPAEGLLACKDVGTGRMEEPAVIMEKAAAILTEKDLLGKRVLISAGASIEQIDPVRYISNYSSGKMGLALARRAWMRGAEVEMAAPEAVLEKAPKAVLKTAIASTEDLYQAMLQGQEKADIVILAAAPCDFRPESTSRQKIKKNGSGQMLLKLVETPDIAHALGEKKRPGQVLIGFAAETENLLDNARKKLSQKHLDCIVANDVSQEGAGFFVDSNIISILDSSGETSYPLMSKEEAADIILTKAKELF